MSKSTVTFESLNKEMEESLNLEKLKQDLSQESLTGLKLCILWKVIGKFVKLALKIPGIPPKVRGLLEIVVTTFDGICG